MEGLDLTGLVLPRRLEISRRSEDGRSAQFIMTPLERGFGQTLGNAIRRALLSSLPGAAVWAFRMDSVLHEHQTVPGVVEDVHQIIQALKSLVVTLDEGVDEAVLDLRVITAGPVTADRIQKRGPVTIVNPEHHLFTLQEDRSMGMTLYINRGRGFVAAEAHEPPKEALVDLVRVDSIYNPVLRANFTVAATRVGQRTDFDQLELLVETDGSMVPEDAVSYAAELVRQHFGFMLGFAEPSEEDEVPYGGAIPVPAALAALFERPIEDLKELSSRSVNSLKKVGVETLGDLVKNTEAEVLKFANFGAKSLDEIRELLDEYNLRLGLKLEVMDDGGLYLVDMTVEEAEAAERAAEARAALEAEASEPGEGDAAGGEEEERG